MHTVFFRGTDDRLWMINSDGTGLVNIGGNKTKSSPFVVGGYVYFQGTDDRLLMTSEGSDGAWNTVHVDEQWTASTPSVMATRDFPIVYFRGTDDRLLMTSVGSDGVLNTVPIGVNKVNKTTSTPFVEVVTTPYPGDVQVGNYVYFRGTDDGLNVIYPDGSQSDIGGNKTKSSPFVVGGYVYFQGTDDRLWMVRYDGKEQVNIGGNKTKSSPFVAVSTVYFQGADDRLLTIDSDDSDGTSLVNIGKQWTASTPFVRGW